MLLEEYNPEWGHAFNKIARALHDALKGLEYTIEHMGSTSVPNLAAKPIIDIDIIYQEESAFGKIKSRLQKIGYYHNGDQGIEAREVFKRNGLVQDEILDHINHHLYACPSDSKALERHILFRDALRDNEPARLIYQRMKYEVAEKANQNRKVYAELKERYVNDFIDELIGLT